jgi:hypothetical protein
MSEIVKNTLKLGAFQRELIQNTKPNVWIPVGKSGKEILGIVSLAQRGLASISPTATKFQIKKGIEISEPEYLIRRARVAARKAEKLTEVEK